MRFVRVPYSALGLSAAALALALACLPAAGQGSAPAAAAADPCPDLLKKAASAAPEARVQAWGAALKQRCQPMPEEIWTALKKGTWADSKPVTTLERANLLGMAVEQGYSQAETLAVTLIESGRWPEGNDLSLEEGGVIIRSLRSALTPYRVRLLLDVYDQQTSDYVRFAVLQALAGSKSDEALLPALDAFWNGTEGVQQQGYLNLMGQPEKAPIKVLARLIRNLPKGGLLDWALRLASTHPGEPDGPVAEARKARGV